MPSNELQTKLTISTPSLAFNVVRCGCRFVRKFSSTLQSEQLVLVESADSGIRVLTLNNEKQANCLSLAMIHELHSAIKQVKEVNEIRAVVIRGAGRFFCCGHDLGEFVGDNDSKLPATVFTACANMMIDLANLPVPSIASVGGIAYGTGCQLVATCDMAVAGQSAKFVAAPIRLGLFGSTPGVALVRAIGMRATKELLFTGCTIDADRAYELNLVNHVVSDDHLLEYTLNLAQEVAKNSKPVMEMGKRALHAQADLDLSEAYNVANQVMLNNLRLKDTQMGIQAFLNKQPIPDWTHEDD